MFTGSDDYDDRRPERERASGEEPEEEERWSAIQSARCEGSVYIAGPWVPRAPAGTLARLGERIIDRGALWRPPRELLVVNSSAKTPDPVFSLLSRMLNVLERDGWLIRTYGLGGVFGCFCVFCECFCCETYWDQSGHFFLLGFILILTKH